MVNVLMFVLYGLLLLLAFVLARSFWTSRNVGFLVLAVAVLLWPYLGNLSIDYVHGSLNAEPPSGLPADIVTALDLKVGDTLLSTHYLVGIVRLTLLLLAVWLLCKQTAGPRAKLG